jgi:sterol desaturase/sphingolipid hydroxylase (fatty acid hydroxylase superfamily)
MDFSYQISPSIFVLIGVVSIMVGIRYTLFKVPAIAKTHAFNKEENKKKWRAKEIYAQRVKSSERVSLITNLVFFVAILPFFVTWEMQSIGKMLLDIFLLLMVYDFFYYFMHRFLFHGTGYFKRVHGIHHQARNPTSVDSLLLHPLEAFLGVALFMVTTVLIGLIFQEPFHVLTLIISMTAYTQINQLNHVKMDLHQFPFKPFTWIADKHAIHHIDMSHGNYSTITLLFDKIFGSYE